MTVMPATYDLRLYRGDTFRLPLRLRRNVGTAEEPVWEGRDLTGHTPLAQIRRHRGGPLVVEFDVDIDLDDPGRVVLSLTAEQARLVTGGVWDFQTTSVEFGVRTWVHGPVHVTRDVSEPAGV